jgi:hypothetical protein
MRAFKASHTARKPGLLDVNIVIRLNQDGTQVNCKSTHIIRWAALIQPCCAAAAGSVDCFVNLVDLLLSDRCALGILRLPCALPAFRTYLLSPE